MHFRLLLLLVSLSYTQSFYKSAIGFTGDSYSAKSIALGSTSSITDRSATSIFINPSNMLFDSNKGFSVTMGSLMSSMSERRSLVLKDFFGDYLAEGDYVKNNIINNSLILGLKYKIRLKPISFSVGVSSIPYNNYNYRYEEEVRGQLPSDDGSIFSRDPLLGYHIYETDGHQNLWSVGSGIKLELGRKIAVGIGASYNRIQDGSINEKIYIDTLIAEGNMEISSIGPYEVNYELPSDGVPKPPEFITFGANIKINRLLINFSYQDSMYIERHASEEDLLILESSLSDYISLYGSNQLGEIYLTDYFNLKMNEIHKPVRYNLSLAILDSRSIGFNLVLNYEKNEYEKASILNSYERYSIGVEYFTPSNLPLRFGIGYKTSPFKPYISSVSSFSLGSGFKAYNLIVDYAFDYRHTKFYFPDFFPVEDENRPNLDIINETELNFIMTLTYNF